MWIFDLTVIFSPVIAPYLLLLLCFLVWTFIEAGLQSNTGLSTAYTNSRLYVDTLHVDRVLPSHAQDWIMLLFLALTIALYYSANMFGLVVKLLLSAAHDIKPKTQQNMMRFLLVAVCPFWAADFKQWNRTHCWANATKWLKCFVALLHNWLTVM